MRLIVSLIGVACAGGVGVFKGMSPAVMAALDTKAAGSSVVAQNYMVAASNPWAYPRREGIALGE